MKVFEAPFYVEIILYLLGGISLLVLATLFYYVPAISVMHAKKNGVFGYSVKLVKNNILPIIILIVLALLSPAYTYVNTYLFDVSHYNFFVEVVLGLIKLIPMWFMEPFIVSIPVVALFLTEGGKQEDLNVIVSSKPKNEFDYLQ
jgi:Zn-dependent protease with chaperone function